MDYFHRKIKKLTENAYAAINLLCIAMLLLKIDFLFIECC